MTEPEGYIPPAIDEREPVAPCCAAMRSAVIAAYRDTWHRNLELIGQRQYDRGYADGVASCG